MNRIIQHIPSFIDVNKKLEWINFNTIEELLNIPFVKQWAKPMDGKDFLCFALYGNYLLVIHDDGFHWWTVGYIENSSSIDLPKWIGGKYQAQMLDGSIKILTSEVISVCGNTLILKS